jgi:hypothetical protein
VAQLIREYSEAGIKVMAVTAHQTVGQNLTEALIHYTHPDAFWGRIAFWKPIPIFCIPTIWLRTTRRPSTNTGRTWLAFKPGRAALRLAAGTPSVRTMRRMQRGPEGQRYNYIEAVVGTFTGEPRGELNEEEGVSPNPKRIDIFMMKNNYYRWMNPKAASDFAGKPGFTPAYNMSRAWLWHLTLEPGKPVHFPKTDYAFVFLGGGLIRETHNGVPEMVHKVFSEIEVDPTDKTVEAVSNRVRIVVVEFK